MSAPPNPKADHYLAQLETALVSGQWTSNAPAKAIGGAPLSWAELFRKFRKHCPTAGVNAELAATLHAMALLGVRSSVGSELEADDRTVDGDLRFNDECVLPNEARDEARALYDKLDTVTDKSESVRCTLGYFAYALGEPEKALELLKHVQLKETDTRSQWALVERVRSLALLGMVKERLALPDSIDYYKAAISALSPPSPTNQNPANELARWGERALWRACALTALNRRPFDELMDLLRSYVTHSARWPAPFRSRHRATLLRLHLHLLTAHPPPSPISQRSGRLAWLHESRNTVGELRMVLTGSTKFPASGTRNAAVEAFVDACVRIWEVSGAQGDQSDWVIDILYWSMRYTFNSTRVLRHLSRLLAASGDIPLSKRILTLYIKLMQHARKASDMSRHDDTNGTTNGDTMPALTEDGSDSDAVWLHSVVQGIRMLCRTGNAEDAAPFIPLLDEVLRRCHLPEAQMQEARNAANLATAVWNFVMAVNSYSDESRKKYFFNAHASLHDLAGPSAAYHRALLLSLEGAARRPEAIAAARDAVEGAPREIRGWHLLALLLAADGEYNAARDILEIGAAPAETGAASVAEPIATASIDVLQGWNEEWTGWPQADQEDWAKHDEREDALQLRMTQVAIIEVVLGPEGASKRWLEVFTWWSQVFPVETTSSHQTPEIPALALTRTMTPPTEADESQPDGLSALSRPAIQLIPPSPNEVESSNDFLSPTNEKSSEKRDRHRNQDDEGDKDKLMTKMREQVVKGRERIDTISKKIVVGVARGRSNSTSERQRRASGSSALDFSLVLSRTNSYQASSIHSRGQVQVQQGARSASPQLGSPYGTIVRRRSPSPPPPPPPPAPSAEKEKAKGREKRERRLRSELWLMSAASFRRQGRFEHARGAIQYAEACDAGNANVFTQLGLLHAAQRSPVLAGQALDKALMLDPDNVQALSHRARLYLEAGEVDLAEGIVTGLVSGPGWSTAEAWFVRAQAAGQQGRRKEQRQWLEHALFLCEGRSVRNVGDALGWCL